MKIKYGIFAIYHNEVYAVSNYGQKNANGNYEITSYDREDLEIGFNTEHAKKFIIGFFNGTVEEYFNKYGFYCNKEISPEEISSMYEIKRHAFYKGEPYCIMGGRAGHIALSKDIPFNLPSIELEEWKKKMENMGFRPLPDWHGPLNYIGSIPLDDPDLQIIEERVDIPI
ncbi:hypothetical protein FACS1894132_11710 [Clostridia bacterium]|nr:hypothetical protein FACS1894132_11710 [Clostridia bacterium]